MRKWIVAIVFGSVATITTAASAAPPCIAFVHGHRGDDDNGNYSMYENGDAYWEMPGWIWREGDFAKTGYFTAENGNFLYAATRNWTIDFAVINYSSHSYYWDVAGQVAGDLNRVCSQNSWIVSHSMGGRVMSWIMGNAVSGDPYYNYGGARYDLVRAKYIKWVSVSGAHDGTASAEAKCGTSSWSCNVAAVFAGSHCCQGVESLQHSWSPQYENGTRVSTLLIGGYEAMLSSGCLDGEDDGVVEHASMFFCNNHPDDNNSVGYDRFCSSNEDVDTSLLDGCGDNPSNKCQNNNKQRSGYLNYDTGHEDHANTRGDDDRGDRRRAVANGYWGTSITNDSVDHGWTGSAASEIGYLAY